jgi:hypothetical protein
MIHRRFKLTELWGGEVERDSSTHSTSLPHSLTSFDHWLRLKKPAKGVAFQSLQWTLKS